MRARRRGFVKLPLMRYQVYRMQVHCIEEIPSTSGCRKTMASFLPRVPDSTKRLAMRIRAIQSARFGCPSILRFGFSPRESVRVCTARLASAGFLNRFGQ